MPGAVMAEIFFDFQPCKGWWQVPRIGTDSRKGNDPVNILL